MNDSVWASAPIREHFETPDRTVEVDECESSRMEADERPAAQLAHRLKIEHGQLLSSSWQLMKSDSDLGRPENKLRNQMFRDVRIGKKVRAGRIHQLGFRGVYEGDVDSSGTAGTEAIYLKPHLPCIDGISIIWWPNRKLHAGDRTQAARMLIKGQP